MNPGPESQLCTWGGAGVELEEELAPHAPHLVVPKKHVHPIQRPGWGEEGEAPVVTSSFH